MKAWAAAAEQVDVIFVNNLGGLIIPSSRITDCMTTYPGILSGTVLSLKQAFSRGLWDPNIQHLRIGDTDYQWIFTGEPFAECKHQNNAASTSCYDTARIQTLCKNSKFKAVFHRRNGIRRQLNIVGNVWTVKQEGMWSKKLWQNTCGNCTLVSSGAVRFGKVNCIVTCVFNSC